MKVFFRGIPNDEGIITEVSVLARGNKTSVPAILNAMKKGEVIIHNHPSGFFYILQMLMWRLPQFILIEWLEDHI